MFPSIDIFNARFSKLRSASRLEQNLLGGVAIIVPNS